MQYIKLYDWMSVLPLEERVVFATIFQYSLMGEGLWATAKTLADRLGIPKSVCKRSLESLMEKGAIDVKRADIAGKNRKVYYATNDFTRKHMDADVCK